LPDVVIVGAGVAGCTAAVQLVRQGASVALLDRAGQAGGLIENAYAIENCPFLSPGTSGAAVANKLRSWLAAWSIPVVRAGVRRVFPQASRWEVTATDGQGWRSMQVILAVGTEPAPFDLPQQQGDVLPPVHREIREVTADRYAQGETIAIIGGGDVAFDYALSAACSLGLDVHLLVRRETPRAVERLQRTVGQTNRIHVHCRTRIGRAYRDAEGASVLELDGPGAPKILRAQAILAAVGRRSALAGLELPPVGVAKHLDGSTEQPGLYIIGDARRGATGQMTMAAGDGLAAALAVHKPKREIPE